MSMLKASRNSELGRSVLVSSVNVEKKSGQPRFKLGPVGIQDQPASFVS